MAIGTGWVDGAWIDAGWVTEAWSDEAPPSGSGKPMLLLGVGFIIPDMAIALALIATLAVIVIGP